MDYDGLMGWVLCFCEWIMRFVYINLFWLVFMLFGFGVFGVMFVIVVLFVVMWKWI